MDELRNAVASANTSQQAYLAACRSVLSALSIIDHELTESIRTIWPNRDKAAQWICSPLHGELSPAEMVLAGQSDLVRSIICKFMHGFY